MGLECFLPTGPTSKEQNPLQFLVVEKVVEGPQDALLTKRVRFQVRVVAVGGKGIQHYSCQELQALILTAAIAVTPLWFAFEI